MWVKGDDDRGMRLRENSKDKGFVWNEWWGFDEINK